MTSDHLLILVGGICVGFGLNGMLNFVIACIEGRKQWPS